MNVYAMVGNDAVNSFDLLGMAGCKDIQNQAEKKCCCRDKHPMSGRNAGGRAKNIKCCMLGGEFETFHNAQGQGLWECVLNSTLESYGLAVAVGIAQGLANQAKSAAAASGKAAGKAALRGALKGIIGGGAWGLGVTITYYTAKCANSNCYVNGKKTNL